MTHWQFLIQRETDQDWLPLESPSIEILEGRYQLIALTQAPQHPVQVQICHWDDHHDFPQEQLQEHLQYADDQGALKILPPVYLGTGIWKIQCHIVDTQAPASSWATHTLEMQVLPQEETGDCGDWEYLEASSPLPCLHDADRGDPSSLTAVQAEAAPVHLILGAENLIRDRTFAELEPRRSSTPPSPPISLHDRQTLTDAAQHPEVEPCPRQKAELALPSFPADIAPLPLRLSVGLRMPPDLGVRHTVLEQLAPLPQLPEFHPLPAERPDPMDPVVVAARSIAQQINLQVCRTLNQDAINQDFQALPLKNRFWQTLNQLATVPEMTPEVNGIH